MRRSSRLMRRLTLLLVLGAACGQSSNSEVSRDGSAGGTGGSAATGGTGAAAAGMGGSTGTAGTGGTAGSAAGNCAPRAAFAEASHTVLQVKWDAGTATSAGTGVVHLWARAAWTASGNTLTGMVKACGTVLPLAGLTQLVGGGMILIEIPTAAWDAPGMPSFPATQTQTGWNVGDTTSNSYAVLIGYTMANGATADWPASYTGITTTDDPDGDASPALTALPRSSAGYVLPPTSAIGALLGGSRADKLYLVTRNVASTTSTRTSCDESSGTATFMHFDNHVVGCHVSGGGECKSSEVDFIDMNRTVFQVLSATIKTKVVPDGATCADVRAALPM